VDTIREGTYEKWKRKSNEWEVKKEKNRKGAKGNRKQNS
jgi:hypothetical protein